MCVELPGRCLQEGEEFKDLGVMIIYFEWNQE